MYLTHTLIILAAVIIFVILYFKYKYTYWAKRNVKFIPPKIPFGNNSNPFFPQKSFGETITDYYNKLDKQNVQYGGIYLYSQPALLLVDPEIIKLVLTKNFGSFHNRRVFSDEVIDPLTGNMFAAKSAKWNFLRTKLSPTFTSTKIKMMFPMMVACAEQLEHALKEPAKKLESIEIKDILARYTMDVIGSCVFGLNCNCLKNPDEEFRKYGRMIFEDSAWDTFRRTLSISVPRFYKLFKIPVHKPAILNFFLNIFKQTVAYREQNKINRNDFLNLLIKLKNNENIEDDETIDSNKAKSNKPALTLNDILAQSFLFFTAGFETSSSTMMFCLFELCLNNNIQAKVRNEITKILKRYNGKITYEAITEMTYIDQVLNETLRKYPILPTLDRECTEEFQLPDSNIVIEKGTAILIPVLGIHRNSKYFPNPMKFDPERFSQKNEANLVPYTYLPFGEGPRICIGQRFGSMQSKIGLAILLKNYKFTLAENMSTNFRFDPKSVIVMSVVGGVWLNASKI